MNALNLTRQTFTADEYSGEMPGINFYLKLGIPRSLTETGNFGSGEFVVVNKHLLSDLTEMGLWTPALKNKVIYHGGSIQNIQEIPEDMKSIYR